jgi:hypothetical protein
MQIPPGIDFVADRFPPIGPDPFHSSCFLSAKVSMFRICLIDRRINLVLNRERQSIGSFELIELAINRFGVHPSLARSLLKLGINL